MTADLRQQAEHGARLLGLTLSQDQLGRVAAILGPLSHHVAVVLALELPPDIEPAQVFVP